MLNFDNFLGTRSKLCFCSLILSRQFQKCVRNVFEIWVLVCFCRTERVKAMCGQEIHISPKHSPNILFILANYCPHQCLDYIFPRKLPTSCLNLHIFSLTSLYKNQHLIFMFTSCQHIHLTSFFKVIT